MKIHKYSIYLLVASLIGCMSTGTDVRTLQRQRNVAELINIIHDSSDKEQRLAAINALAYVRDPRTISGLSSALDSDSWVEREAAVKSLSKLNDFLVINPLVKALDDNNRFVRASAEKGLLSVSQTLGKNKEPRVLSHLISAIQKTQSTSRETCVNAFQAAVAELSQVNEPTFLQELVSASNDDNKYVRQEALRALGQFDDPRIIEPLVKALVDNSAEVRDIAIGSLHNISNPHTAELLFKELNNDDPAVRNEVAFVLGKFKDPSIVNKVILALSDKNRRTRAGAAMAMEHIVHPRAMMQLVKLLDDNDADVRLAASNTLEKYHWRPHDEGEAAKYCVAKQQWDNCAKYKNHAIKPLLVALKGEHPEVRRHASAVLTRLNWHPKQDSEKGQFCVAKKDWEECRTLGKLAVPALIQELDNEEWSLRVNAADTLAKIADPRAIEPLVRLVQDDNAVVRITAVEALGVFKDKRVVKPLIRALDDNNRMVRNAAIEVLDNSIDDYTKLNDTGIVDAFLLALKDNNRGVRKVAARLLGALKDPKSVPALVEALNDVDSNVRQAANQSLLKIKDPRAIKSLVAGLEAENPEVRSEVVNALSQYKDHRAIEPLLESIHDRNADVRIKSIRALARIKDPRAIEPIISALKDLQPSVRQVAASVLVKIDDQRTIDPLKETLSDLDVNVRIAARNTLLEKKWTPATKAERGYYCIAKKDWIQCEETGKAAIKPLLLELSQPESPFQDEAARVLGEIKDPGTIQSLIDAIASTQWYDDEEKRRSLIRSATMALRKFGIQAVPFLKPTLTQWYTAQYTAAVLNELSWQPRSDEEEIHYLVAKRANNDLQALWPDAKRVLMKDIASKDADKISNALYAFIGIGKEEIISDLLNLLDNYGTVQIAEAYLNSGNEKLVNGAVSWTNERGLQVYKYSDGNSPVQWGRL